MTRTHRFTAARRRGGRKLLAIGALAAMAAALAACGSSGGSSGSTTPAASGSSAASGVDQSLRALLPANVLAKGTLTVATTAEYPPYEFLATDNTTIIGVDPSFAAALGKLFGIKVSMVNTGFPTVVSGLEGGKFDAALDTISDTKSTESAINLIDYLSVGSQLIVNSGNPKHVTDLASLCGTGMVASATKGSGQADMLSQQSATCTSAGKGSIKIQLFDDQPSQLLALQSGRIQVMAAGGGNAAYIADQEGGRFEVLPAQYFPRLYGIGVNKSQTQLQKAIVAGMEKLVADGTYEQILKKWNITGEAVKSITVNAASS